MISNCGFSLDSVSVRLSVVRLPADSKSEDENIGLVDVHPLIRNMLAEDACDIV